jgi:hypothetical protein
MSGSTTQTTFHKRRNFLPRKVIELDLEQSPKSPEGEKILWYFLSLYCILIEILSRVANASRTSQGEIYILRRCFSCKVQKTGMGIVFEIFHPFPFYDLEDKLRFFASKSTVYLFGGEPLQIWMC